MRGELPIFLIHYQVRWNTLIARQGSIFRFDLKINDTIDKCLAILILKRYIDNSSSLTDIK
ncbi:hypothetical protein A3749_17410 [Oleiphilus sp. HI0078]|nr:hypothetical protein A3749_17410 [Oleiphilus sp. HI0078]